MQKRVHIGLYRILRKMGAKRHEINLNESLTNLIDFDDQEWLCFYFFIESRFDISLTENEEKSLQTVASTIKIIEKKLSIGAKSTNTISSERLSMVG